jgi:hypothetical protein
VEESYPTLPAQKIRRRRNCNAGEILVPQQVAAMRQGARGCALSGDPYAVRPRGARQVVGVPGDGKQGAGICGVGAVEYIVRPTSTQTPSPTVTVGSTLLLVKPYVST